MTRKVDLRGASRRDFIKSVFAASAALGLGPTRAMEMLDEIGGSALAQAASVLRRTVNIVGGTGAHSWHTLLWPTPRIISGFNSAFAYDNPSVAIPSTSPALQGRQLYVRSVNGKTLWQNYGDNKLVTAMVCGTSTAHSPNPTNTLSMPDGVGGAVGLYAGMGAIQSTLNALVPVIGIKFNGNDMPYGAAPGAPSPASVSDANAMVGLFSSAASRLAQRLQQPANQSLFALYHKAFLGLTRTANVITYSRAKSDSGVAVQLLAENLGQQLQPKPGQVNTWCGGTNPVTQQVSDLATSLIVTSNSFKLGLTAEVNIPFANDDPHPAFANIATTTKTADQMVNILNSFMDDLATTNDPANPSTKLSDSVIMTFSGDTPKNPYIASGWPDSTPSGRNWIYVMSQGMIKPGWFGDVQQSSTTDFDPSTGKLVPSGSTVPASAILDGVIAAILYAVTDGDDRRVRDFTTAANYMAIVNPILTG